MLRAFNENEELDLVFKKKLEKYFEYKWSQDKNGVMEDAEHGTIVEQLNSDMENKIYLEYLFPEFIKFYQSIF